jgi:hypothetical protein
MDSPRRLERVVQERTMRRFATAELVMLWVAHLLEGKPDWERRAEAYQRLIGRPVPGPRSRIA